MGKLLDDIVVLDFSRVLAGPFCTMTLADMGARVIKIEPPSGDEARGMGPFALGNSLYFASVNRGKESVVLDLKRLRGLEIALELARGADVLVENYRPGAMDRLGLGHERVSAANPGIVYASLSGFGQTGPYSARGAYDVIIQAMSGLMSITGPAGGQPTRVGASIGDIVPALYAVAAIVAALFRRERTGAGCRLDIAMMDAAFAVVENALARYWVGGKDPAPLGNRHPSIAPFSAFATRDGQLVLACGNDALWHHLCVALGAPGLADDPRFLTNALRTENVEELAGALEGFLAAKPAAEWIDILTVAGVPCAKVNAMSDLLRDPSLIARNMIREVEVPGVGPMPTPGSPIKGDSFDDSVGVASPELGGQTFQVLAEFLGLGSVELEALEESGVIGRASRRES